MWKDLVSHSGTGHVVGRSLPKFLTLESKISICALMSALTIRSKCLKSLSGHSVSRLSSFFSLRARWDMLPFLCKYLAAQGIENMAVQDRGKQMNRMSLI